MIEAKTLPNVSLMPVESDVWFLNKYTGRDYTITVSKKSCHECGSIYYGKDDYESYCNHCGKIRELESYINKRVYNGFTHDMKVLKNRSTHLKEIETQLKNIEPDYNKKYRDFKHRYYNLFMEIAYKDYYIPTGTANDLFYLYFRGFYDLNKRKGVKREKLVRKFLDRISINPREYFMTQAPEKLQKKVLGKFKHIDITEDDDDSNNGQPGASRIPVISEGQLNVTGKRFTGRKVSYHTYLTVNEFTDSPSIRMKYIKRYCEDYTLLNIKYTVTPEDYDRKSVAEPVTPIPVLNEDYIPFNSLGLEDMIINTVQYPSRSKYQGLDVEKDIKIQELKKKQPYYNTNLNNYIYTNKPENKQVEPKTENPHTKNTTNKSEIKTIGGTLITERMNKHPYKNRIYPLKLTICKNCPKSSRLWINKKYRQYLCTYCKQ